VLRKIHFSCVNRLPENSRPTHTKKRRLLSKYSNNATVFSRQYCRRRDLTLAFPKGVVCRRRRMCEKIAGINQRWAVCSAPLILLKDTHAEIIIAPSVRASARVRHPARPRRSAKSLLAFPAELHTPEREELIVCLGGPRAVRKAAASCATRRF